MTLGVRPPRPVDVLRSAHDRLLNERCGPRELGLSYALRPYRPPVPSAGRPRSSHLLAASLSGSDHADLVAAVCLDARAAFGLEHTVWSIKVDNHHPTWELYWYDHALEGPLTLGRVKDAFGQRLRWSFEDVDLDRPYWSISVDLDAASLERQEVLGVHVYAPRSTEPATCVSYRLLPTGLILENTYFLFAGENMVEQAAAWVQTSPISTGSVGLFDVDLADADHLALAHKPTRDGVYFGGLSPEVAVDLLKREGSASWAVDLVRSDRGELDHLLLDVGLDIARTGDHPHVLRTALHGVV